MALNKLSYSELEPLKKWCTKDIFDNRYGSQVKVRYRLIFANVEIRFKSVKPSYFPKNALSNEPTCSFVALLADE